MSELVECRAFRGTRRKSVYRSHSLPAGALRRIAEAGKSSGLALAASLLTPPVHLDKEEAGRLADELSELRVGAHLLELDHDVTALAELARFCARSRGGSWLTLTPSRG